MCDIKYEILIIIITMRSICFSNLTFYKFFSYLPSSFWFSKNPLGCTVLFMQGSRQFPHGSLATNSRNPTSNQSINQWIDQEPPTMERCKDNGAVGWERAQKLKEI